MSKQLTNVEKSAFDDGQQKQLDRLTQARRDSLLDVPAGLEISAADFRSKILRSLARLTPEELRARLNICCVIGESAEYDDMSDYTAAERQTIAVAIQDGYTGGWQRAIARALG